MPQVLTPQFLKETCDVAVHAAREAGTLIRFHAGRIDPRTIKDKGTHDLLTFVDEEAQRIIVELLQKEFPSFDVLGEEGPGPIDRLETIDGFRWIVDPIDGTTNFTRGVPPYAVSIGLQYKDQLVTGVVLDVSRNELFTAVAGGGLYVNGRKAGVSITEDLHESLITTGFPYRSFDHVKEYQQSLEFFMRATHGLRRPGCASVDLAYVACGRFDGYFETGLMPWDVAAGIVLVSEGGGCVTDFDGNSPRLYGKEFLASNGKIHSAMQEGVEPLRMRMGR